MFRTTCSISKQFLRVLEYFRKPLYIHKRYHASVRMLSSVCVYTCTKCLVTLMYIYF